jgi:glycosyltransferase involved in cell wall biosynthesis
MSINETLTLTAYFFVLIILAVYGWHRYYLVYLYMRNKDRQPKPGPLPDPLPVVTIQLPLYNEMYVADRLIDAVCRIEYPRERLEIQVLDDSTDETGSIADLAVRRFAAQGFDIKYFHRANRVGYKAGALEAGLKVARGEFVAIFDADFIPSADFPLRMVPHSPATGSLWYIKAKRHQPDTAVDEDPVDSADGHFVLEHGGRNRAGRFFNFNGRPASGAVGHRRRWRLAARHATEDLDLSYRRSCAGGSSCSSPISSRPPKCRSR